MKKFIALFLSVIMMFSCLGIAASATSVVGRSSAPMGSGNTTPTTQPSREENNVVNNVTNITNNVTNNNITIMPEEDPTTLFGFLYRVIKTIVPYLYKILSMLRIDISFGAQNACGTCGSTNGCNCNGNGTANDNTVIVIPSIPSGGTNGGSTNGGSTNNGGNAGNVDSDSADSDSADSDSDSMDSILGSLFGDLFA